MEKFKEKFPEKYEKALEGNSNFRPVCDKCKIEFPVEEILIQKLTVRMEFAGLLGVRLIDDNKNQWGLISPCCEKPHVYGFDDITDIHREA